MQIYKNFKNFYIFACIFLACNESKNSEIQPDIITDPYPENEDSNLLDATEYENINIINDFPKSYGGNNEDFLESIFLTQDGGFLAVGDTKSYGTGDFDVMVLKLTASGDIQWQIVFGETNYDIIGDANPTSDGGYILTGTTKSLSADQHESAWVVKLDSMGNVEWKKVYRTGNNIGGKRILQEPATGKYFLVGKGPEPWLALLDSTGNIEWGKIYSGTGQDMVNSIILTSYGTIFLAGGSSSFFDDWRRAPMILKITSNGDLIWAKAYTFVSDFEVIAESTDGALLTGGIVDSLRCNCYKMWVMKLTQDGDIIWSYAFGESKLGGGNSSFEDMVTTSDGGCAVAGSTEGFGLENRDYWVIKLSSEGIPQWQYTFGGESIDEANAIKVTNTGGYIVGGYSYSFGEGDKDWWVLKLTNNGRLAVDCFQPSMTTSADNNPGQGWPDVKSGNIAIEEFAPTILDWTTLVVSSISCGVQIQCRGI